MESKRVESKNKLETQNTSALQQHAHSLVVNPPALRDSTMGAGPGITPEIVRLLVHV